MSIQVSSRIKSAGEKYTRGYTRSEMGEGKLHTRVPPSEK